MYVSFREGGVVCAGVAGTQVDATFVPASTVAWMRFLLGATFAEVVESGMGLDSAFSVLRFCQEWVREHVGASRSR